MKMLMSCTYYFSNADGLYLLPLSQIVCHFGEKICPKLYVALQY